MGAGWQVLTTILSCAINDKETMDAIGRGEQVTLFGGVPHSERDKRRERESRRSRRNG